MFAMLFCVCAGDGNDHYIIAVLTIVLRYRRMPVCIDAGVCEMFAMLFCVCAGDGNDHYIIAVPTIVLRYRRMPVCIDAGVCEMFAMLLCVCAGDGNDIYTVLSQEGCSLFWHPMFLLVSTSRRRCLHPALQDQASPTGGEQERSNSNNNNYIAQFPSEI